MPTTPIANAGLKLKNDVLYFQYHPPGENGNVSSMPQEPRATF